MAGLAIRILNHALQFGPFSQDTEWFNNDDNFAAVMGSTLRLQNVITTEIKLLAATQTEPELRLRGWKERADSRILLVAGWARARPSQLDVAVDLRDAQLSDNEGLVLAAIMERCEKVVSIDLRGNPDLNESLDELIRVMNAQRPGRPRSLVGVSSLNTRLDVPRHFKHESDLRLTAAELESHGYSESVSAGMGSKGPGVGVISLNRRGGADTSGKGGFQPLLWATRIDHHQLAEQVRGFAAGSRERATHCHGDA